MALFANKSRRRGSAWALGEVEQRALPLQVQPGSPYSAFGAANWPYSPFSERPSSSGADGAPLSAEAALRIADVWACVRVLADAASSLPLRAYRRSGQDRAPYAGPLAGLLARPAPASTLADLVSTIVAHLNLHGNAYLGKYRDAQGRITQLVPLPPTAITPGLDAGEPFYLLSTPSGTTRHSTADITHIRGLSLDGIVGLSPLGAARAVSLSSSLAAHADAFARGGARVGGILSAPNVTNPESLQRMAAGWGETHGHVDQSGKIAVVAGEIRFQQLALSMVDADFVAQRNLSTGEIARIFRVPPWMIGAGTPDSLTYSNTENQSRSFVDFSLAPWATRIEQALSEDEDLSPGSVFVEFDMDRLLRGDTAARAAYYGAALDPAKGWMSRADVRRLENLPPEPAAPPASTPPGLSEISSPEIAAPGGPDARPA